MENSQKTPFDYFDSDNLILIDGSGYIFRAYYALPEMKNPKGIPINAVFGFTNMIIKYNKTMPKSIINYILSPFPRGLSGVVFGIRPKALGNDIVLIFGNTNFAKTSHSCLCG